jgi:hypothetical protein
MRGFSPRQVVTVVVSVCATIVLMPTAVWAAGSSLVRLTDGTGKVAQVSGAGHLLVGDGSGPITVDGAVAARPVAPAQPWNTVNAVGLSASNSEDVVYGGVIGHPVNITSFSAAATSGSAIVHVQVLVNGDAGGSCYGVSGPTGNFAAAERFTVAVPTGQTVVLTYPTPLVYTAYGDKGKIFCVMASASGSSGFEVTVNASGFVS